jgi:Adenylate and Guanylate cyclase catalytic domain
MSVLKHLSVNTAARMESNGKPGRIHISETTAAKLREAGKSQWVIPRADKIVAKGKGEWIEIDDALQSMVVSLFCTDLAIHFYYTLGEMQTYWLASTLTQERTTTKDTSTAEDSDDFSEVHVITTLWV